jgi:pyridoxine 5-phosphate synthase
VEIHTGAYAEAAGSDRTSEFTRIETAARQAEERGLIVHAGHGLHYENVQAIAAIDQIAELNIGHSIIARAVFTGIGRAVADMKQLMKDARVR